MFHLYLGFAYLYVLWRFVFPLPISKGGRIALAAVLLVVSKYHLIQIWVFGSMFSPEMPRWAVLVAGWAFCSFVLLFVFVVLADLANGILSVLRIRAAKKLVGPSNRYLAASFALLLSAFGVYQAAQVPGVRTVEVRIKNLPQAMDGLRVVQLTDLHISKLFQTPWVEAVVARTNALNPDLILITGDLMDGTTTDRQLDVAPLAGLTASLGIIGIPGNHEYYFNEPQWRTEFERLGIQMLLNEHVVIGAGTESLVVAGVTDEAAAQFGMAGPNLNAALMGVPETAPIILLKHRPAGADRSAQAGVSLQLSGHTHGGMIKGLDQVGRYANEGFISGAYQVGAMTLYTSNGTGLWNGFPIRIGVPAEITEIILRVDSST
ncbi:metallophosphoesterase [Pseudomonas solani]|uniref:metallophosphoesterase n=1 Tax=Pseudomonas solani TaxID=2731552 RepID=UPI003D6C4B07